MVRLGPSSGRSLAPAAIYEIVPQSSLKNMSAVAALESAIYDGRNAKHAIIGEGYASMLITGTPPAVAGDAQGWTVPGIGSLHRLNRSKLKRMKASGEHVENSVRRGKKAVKFAADRAPSFFESVAWG